MKKKKMKKEKEEEKEKEEKEKEKDKEKEKEEKEKEENEKEKEKEKKEKEENEKEKEKERKLKEDLDALENPIPYQELQAEPSEENKNSDNGNQFMDEEGNVFNFDDLTDEEKMSIIHQQIILQKLQEEAEARGEQFDPQEYLAYLEQQAEEEELMKKKNFNSNKLNKSF